MERYVITKEPWSGVTCRGTLRRPRARLVVEFGRSFFDNVCKTHRVMEASAAKARENTFLLKYATASTAHTVFGPPPVRGAGAPGPMQGLGTASYHLSKLNFGPRATA